MAKVKNIKFLRFEFSSKCLALIKLNKPILHKVCLIFNMIQPDMFYILCSFVWRANNVSLNLVIGLDSSGHASHNNTIVFFLCNFVGIIFMAVNLYQTFRK